MLELVGPDRTRPRKRIDKRNVCKPKRPTDGVNGKPSQEGGQADTKSGDVALTLYRVTLYGVMRLAPSLKREGEGQADTDERKDKMKQTVNVYQDVPVQELRRLAANVCLKAFEEVKGKDVLKALDALFWLTSADFEQWAEWAGLPFADPLPLLTNGRLFQTRIRTKGRNNARRNFETV